MVLCSKYYKRFRCKFIRCMLIANGTCEMNVFMYTQHIVQCLHHQYISISISFTFPSSVVHTITTATALNRMPTDSSRILSQLFFKRTQIHQIERILFGILFEFIYTVCNKNDDNSQLFVIWPNCSNSLTAFQIRTTLQNETKRAQWPQKH